MVKIFISFLLTIYFLTYAARVSMAQGIGGQSALLVKSVQNENLTEKNEGNINYNLKRKTIKRVLQRYNSPFADSADAFVDTCVLYNLDCYLLPSIAGVESYYGKHLMPGSYNPFGWGRGLIYFEDWEDGINIVGKGLRENYIDQGATTVEEIGAIYCEGNTWAPKVRYFMNVFEEEEQNHRLYFSKNTVEL